ncbi:MAG: class I SAM-dependent methyltransferase [Prevotellaceae bacterium]|jgi:hypothetical protein|nr:class I SAM-dependent methyltransferase [Prevotellaceae bacterium]
MMKNMYDKDSSRAIDAIDAANRIAFAPMIFQASRALKNLGILASIERGKGLTIEEIAADTGLTAYGVRVLCEAGLAIGLLYLAEEKFHLSKVAYFFMHNEFTTANTEFVNDVCYNGMFSLDESVRNGKPEGLKTFGTWDTVYEALSQLPENARASWFRFDHYYSDVSFDECLNHVLADHPRKILDIGGNTGRFAIKCLTRDENLRVTVADLPGQLDLARRNAETSGFADRMEFAEINVLDGNQSLPAGYDALWLSQFLDCFSENEIVSILKRCAAALDRDARIFILEPFWDRQRFPTSAFCLIMTSLYFTAIANGNSRIYTFSVFSELIAKAGLCIEKCTDGIGMGHTLLQIKN